MSTIDKRVVEMDFDNQGFEAGTKTSLNSIALLKKSLNFDDSVRSLNGLASAGKSFSLAGIGEGVQNISNSFSALGIMGITILSNIATAALNLGEKLVKVALGIDQIQGGFAEYEQGLTAFQTIVANTKTAGATIDDVNAAMVALNKYANLTIYSFGDMTKAIGLFTAQGVKLDDSVSAIKGIFNIISLTGGDANKANGAIYQLSQAIASGTVRAQDWISVINAGIGGEDFQHQLEQTARVHGVAVDKMIKKEGSFRLSLQDGWLSSQILLETLQQYTGDLSASQLKSMGYSEKQIKQIQELGATANETATKMKSVSQLIETLTSNTVTGWAASFKYVIGDLDEASAIWTEIGGTIGNVLQDSTNARNELLRGWKAFGGRVALIDGIRNAFTALGAILTPISQAMSEVFPAITSQELKMLTVGVRDFVKSLILNEDAAAKVKTIFKGLFSIFDIVAKSIKAVVDGLLKLAGASDLGGKATSILDFAAGLATAVTKFRDWAIANDEFNKTVTKIGIFLGKAKDSIVKFVKDFSAAFEEFKKKFQTFANTVVTNPTVMAVVDGLKAFVGVLVTLFNNVRKIDFRSIFTKISGDFEAFRKTVAENGLFAAIVEGIKNFGTTIGKIFDSFGKVSTGGLDNLGTRISERFGFLSNIGDTLAKIFATMGPRIQKAFSIFSKIMGAVGDILGKIIDAVLNGLDNIDFKNVDFSKFFDTLNAGLLSGLILAVTGFVKNGSSIFDGIKDIFKGVKGFESSSKGVLDGIRGVLDGAKDSFKAWQEQLKAKVLMQIALAVAILAASLIALTLVDSAKLTIALGSLTILFANLFGSIAILDKAGGSEGFGSMGKAAIGLTAISISVGIMTLAVIPLANLDPTKLANAMLSITELVGLVVGASLSLSTNSGTILKTSGGMILFSVALGLLVGSVKRMSDIDLTKLEHGLFGLGVIMGELAIFMKVTDKLNGKAIINSVGILILAGALIVMSVAVGKFGDMKLDTMLTGLAVISGVLAALALFTNMTKKATNVIETAAGLVIIGASMLIFAEAIKRMGALSWDEIGKGLATMAGALASVAVALLLLPKDTLIKSVGLVVVAGALVILAGVMKTLGGMSWDQVSVGLTTLATALGIIAVAMGAMEEGLPGAAAMLVMAAALLVLIPVLTTLGAMSLAQVGIALLAIAGIFTVLGLAGLILTPVVPIIAALAAVLLLFGVACVSIGVGMLAFAAGLTMMAAITGVGVTAITVLITGLIALIPLIATQIAQGIISFAKTVGDGAPVIGEAILACLKAWLNTIVAFTPQFVSTMLDLITQTLKTIADKLPDIIAAGMSIVMAILKGVQDNIYQIVTTAISIVTKFIDAVSAKLPDIIDSGLKLIVAFVSGLADGIDKNTKPMNEACIKLGKAIVDGVIGGLVGGIGSVIGAVQDMANQAVHAFYKAIQARSPSKLFRKIANYIPAGVVLGIKDGSSAVAGAIDDMAGSAISNMTNAVSMIASSIDTNIDANPTIRPVIDLTNIEDGGKQIDSLLSNKTINVSASVSKASSITSGMQATSTIKQTASQASGQIATISLTQINNSPAALSRLEIYRQTKNQISTLRGLIPA
jgi:tape measure domain-containing protein